MIAQIRGFIMTFLHMRGCTFIVLTPRLPFLNPVFSSPSLAIPRVREITSYLSSRLWFILLTLLISNSTCFPTNDVIRCVCMPHFISSSTGGHQSWFHSLAILSSSAMNTVKQILWFLKTQKEQEAFDSKFQALKAFLLHPSPDLPLCAYHYSLLALFQIHTPFSRSLTS